MIRERIRYEDGVEVSRTTEDKTTLREPQTRIVRSGEKIVLAPVGGDIPYEYWYATEMYASVYSPCASGTGGCSYGTASGARAGYGIVAVDYSIYSTLAGMQSLHPRLWRGDHRRHRRRTDHRNGVWCAAYKMDRPRIQRRPNCGYDRLGDGVFPRARAGGDSVFFEVIILESISLLMGIPGSRSRLQRDEANDKIVTLKA